MSRRSTELLVYLAGRREFEGVDVLACMMADGRVLFEHVAHHELLIGFG